MKLIQLNVWAGRLEKQIAGFLRDEQPDIVCLQEAISYPQKDSGFFLSIENMQQLSGLSYSAIAPVFTFRFQGSSAKFGNCILSRFPIQKSEVVFTYLEHVNDFDFNTHSPNVRNFIHSVVKTPEGACNVLTHHGYHIDAHKNGDTETLRQMKILADYTKSLSGPVILSGDFNLAPHSESLESLNDHLTNLSISHRLKSTRTPLTHKTEVCDYIFVNKSVNVNHFTASDELVSDHKALMLEFTL
jgi:endonuclease/exonuclease/phosphatase family metal-dependent hydrolase